MQAAQTTAIPVTFAYGDGIGPEIMEATLTILREAGANITIETIEIGERIYNMGAQYGILPSAWETLCRNKLLLKSPITIPPPSPIPGFPDYKDVNAIIYDKFALAPETLTISNQIPILDTDWLSGSANIGENFALFEAVHDSAPDIAGKNIANPSGIIQAAIMMLTYIGQEETANIIQKAWLKTIADGIHTTDIYRRKISKEKVGTIEFSEAIVERLGRS